MTYHGDENNNERPSMVLWVKKALLSYFLIGLLIVVAIFIYGLWPFLSAI